MITRSFIFCLSFIHTCFLDMYLYVSCILDIDKQMYVFIYISLILTNLIYQRRTVYSYIISDAKQITNYVKLSNIHEEQKNVNSVIAKFRFLQKHGVKLITMLTNSKNGIQQKHEFDDELNKSRISQIPYVFQKNMFKNILAKEKTFCQIAKA